ncbi:hypothetical protein L833_3512 [Mycobacteroides abscessus MAB_091912_2446]|uniref:Transmembrane protein n=1 Tax=Mycobacteroides abscessus MAB_091912_2446 TaxID=1335414 RepID=A0A829M7S9_9MYCO|nr:hypothetical protein L833_3512 [Mycobacteroides abscessus MAB_091912_2446]
MVGLTVCGAAALVTVGAAAWQVAQYTTAAQQMSAAGGCGSACGGCPSAGRGDSPGATVFAPAAHPCARGPDMSNL